MFHVQLVKSEATQDEAEEAVSMSTAEICHFHNTHSPVANYRSEFDTFVHIG